MRGRAERYAPLPSAAEALATMTSAARRRLGDQPTTVAPDVSVLTNDSTVPLKIHVDWGATDERTAVPFSTCFKGLNWFKWQWPWLLG